MQKKYLTTKELSGYLNLAVSTLATYRSDDKGPPYRKIGRLVRYNIEDVEKWLENYQRNGENALDTPDNLLKLSVIKGLKS